MAAILLLIALAVFVAFAVFFAVQISKTLQAVVSQVTRTVSLADQIHHRDQLALQTVLDRLMARDFTEFKDYQLSQVAMEGQMELVPKEERHAERPYLYPPPGESAFKRDHEERYGPSQDASSEDTLLNLEKEGLPR
jgi:hypothetical protein